MFSFAPSVPLYHQIAQVLKMRIEAGELSEGRSLATEQLLCREFGVSRSTVRHALAKLKSEGLLQSRRGVGSRGIPRKVQDKIIRLSGDPLHGALHSRSRIVSLGETAAPGAVASFFGCEPAAPVFRFVRVHYLDERPLSVVISYLPARIGARLSRAVLRQPMHNVLWQKFGLRQDRSHHAVRVGRADSLVSSLLDVALAEPVLRIQSSVFLANGEPLRWTENFFREDRYEYTAEMRWPKPADKPPAASNRKTTRKSR